MSRTEHAHGGVGDAPGDVGHTLRGSVSRSACSGQESRGHIRAIAGPGRETWDRRRTSHWRQARHLPQGSATARRTTDEQDDLVRIDYPRCGTHRSPPLAALVAPAALGGRPRRSRPRRRVRPARRAHRGACSRTTSRPRRPRSSTGTTARPSSAASATPTASTCRSTQVPLDVQHAVLAAEDRDFYEHGGFSPTGIGRAIWNNVSGGRPPGRLDDHAAVRQERLPHPGALLLAQGAGAAARGQARDVGVARTRSSTTTSTPSTSVAAPTASRSRRSSTSASPSATSTSARRRRSRRSSARPATTTRPTRTTSSASRAAGPTCSTAWSRRAGSPRRRRRRRVPQVQEARSRPTASAAPTATCSTRVRQALLAQGITEDELNRGGCAS